MYICQASCFSIMVDDYTDVLDLPKLNIAKPLGTHWMAHKRCVKTVKASYGAMFITFNNIHENTNKPEALRLCKALNKWHTIAAMYMLYYVLQLAKLSRKLQTKQ